jgi:hypothetical protein
LRTWRLHKIAALNLESLHPFRPPNQWRLKWKHSGGTGSVAWTANVWKVVVMSLMIKPLELVMSLMIKPLGLVMSLMIKPLETDLLKPLTMKILRRTGSSSFPFKMVSVFPIIAGFSLFHAGFFFFIFYKCFTDNLKYFTTKKAKP